MKILLIAHGLPPAACGGTEIYTDALARALARVPGDAVHVLARESDPDRPELNLRHEQRDGYQVTFINHTFRNARTFAASYRHLGIAHLTGRMLDRIRPDVAHIQHLTGLGIDLIGELAVRRIPIAFTLNDYWLICHRGQLLDLDLARCDGPGTSGCRSCAGPAAVADARAQSALTTLAAAIPGRFRRLAMAVVPAASAADASARATRERAIAVRAALRPVALFFAPSPTLARRFIDFGIDPGRIVPTRQGIDPMPVTSNTHQPATPLRLGFIGSLMVSKAPHLFLEAVARLPAADVEIHVFGDHAGYHGDESYRTRLTPLLSAPGVRWHGAVGRHQIGSAFAAIDVLVLPSIWLENAPFVISEARAAGVPVVASNLGGMADHIQHDVNGLLFAPGSTADLEQALRRLLDEPALLNNLRRRLPAVRGIAEDAAELRGHYLKLVQSPQATAPGGRLAAVVLNHRTVSQTLLAVRSLQASRRVPDDLLIIDNGSGDDSHSQLEAALPGTQVIHSPDNLGFSGGMNLGIRAALAADAESVLLLNSDAWLPPDALGRMEAALADDPASGIVGAAVLMRHDPARIASLGMQWSPVTGRMRQLGFLAPSATLATAPECGSGHASPGLAGCALLVRRAVFERVGLLDEQYFFSFEDLDYCLRATAAGFTVARAAGARVYHAGGGTLKPASPLRIYYGTRNQLLLATRHAPRTQPAAALRTAAILGYNLAHVLFTAGVPLGSGLQAFVRGAWDHARGRYGSFDGDRWPHTPDTAGGARPGSA